MINAGVYSNQIGAPQHVASAVHQASAKTGVDFSYLLTQAKVESSFDTDVKAKGSSATGLFQFIEQTWLRMVKEHGAEHGRAAWVGAIEQGRGGHFSVKNGMKAEILNGRTDAAFSSLMAGEFANENRETLEGKLGRRVNSTDLYMAHFLGAGGATTFLSAMRDNPLQSAARLFPEAARSNRAVFYDRNGTPNSLAEVYGRFNAKFREAGPAETVMAQGRPEDSVVFAQAAQPIDTTLLLETPSRLAEIEHRHAPARFTNPFAGAYNLIKSPIQTMIGNDLLSTPLLSLFSREDSGYESREARSSHEKRDNFSFNG